MLASGVPQAQEVVASGAYDQYDVMSNRRRIVDDAPYAHFITFGVDRRRCLLDLDPPKRILLGVLNQQLAQHEARCVGFVIMPNHVHAAIWLPWTGQLSRFMHGWKRVSSYRIRAWYRENAPKYLDRLEEFSRFWQPKYHAFAIYEHRKLEEKLNYMHQNPVRAGLVSKTIQWRWSSSRWYELRRAVGVPIEWVD